MGKNCIVAQSGGPTTAINASLAGVVNAVVKSEKYDKIYGALHGIQGVFKKDFKDLTDMDEATYPSIDLLRNSPAMYLGSCRYKMPLFEDKPEVYENVFNTFEEMNVGAFFYIGGNDSMDTAMKLSAYAKKVGSDIKIIGVPKTIDNDMVLTDHTPGYGSAAKYIAATMLEVAHDTYIYDLPCVTIVEIMGRDAGWLTAASALARNTYNPTPQLIYLPEVPFSVERFLEDLKEELKKSNNIVVAVSEGVRDENGDYVSAGVAKNDQFGHVQLSGVGKALETVVKAELGIKCRSIELSILQRCAAHLASRTDLEEAMKLGETAVRMAEEGLTGVVPTIKRKSDVPYLYEILPEDVSLIANNAKPVPLEWITESHNDVTKDLIEYVRPLIRGEVSVSFRDGLPVYIQIPHLT